MKTVFLLPLLLSVLLLSCSNKYKITQTPDDVYYSPVRGIGEEKIDDDNRKSDFSFEDREIRMSRYDNRWNHFNTEYGYQYDPYHYGYNYGYYYNPYYYSGPVYVYNLPSTNPVNTTPRTTNLSSYIFVNTSPSNSGSGPVQFPKPGRAYNNSNQSNNVRDLFSTGNSGNSNPRTYNPSSAPAGNASQSSGTPITRPARSKN